MIERTLCDKVLTIGTPLEHKGGISQVLNTYKNHVFSNFNFISCGGGQNIFHSIYVGLRTIILMILKLSIDRQIQIVHIHTASYKSFWHASHYTSLASLFGKKVVLHIHGGGFADYYSENPVFVKKVLNNCDCVVALTEKWKNFFVETVGCPNVVTINNVIDPPIIDQIEPNDNLVHMLFLGFLVEKKGIFDLVNMLVDYKNELQGKLLLHIGGKGDEDRLNKIVIDNHIEDMVKFEGWVTGKKKIELLNNCYIFILPSYVEGLPISILEAMSYGKVVIATAVGGIPDLITEDNGYLFKPGDKTAMFTIINNIINNKREAKIKSTNGLQSVRLNLPENVSILLKNMYTSLL